MNHHHRLLPCLLLAMAPVFLHAQIPSKCLEIESILVDASAPPDLCPGATEGMNEMVRFRVGPGPIALSELSANWPFNSWLGLVQNDVTAGLTAELSASIQGCGWLGEPPAGIIPPGASVIMVTSTLMCPAANPFTNLNDSLYIIYQNEGNSQGHFRNHNSPLDTTSTPGPVEERTLILFHIPTNCSDTATYDRGQLVNIFGNYGGPSAWNDGATVQFSWPGVPQATYVNYGVQAPYVPVEILIGPPVGDLCGSGHVQLNATVPAGFNLQWQGGTGTFSAPNSPGTMYTAGLGDSGEVVLELCAIGSCGAPYCESITLLAGEVVQLDIVADGPPELCPGGILELTVLGDGDEFLWSTSESGSAITITSPGTYSVSSNTACGQASASITILELNVPVATITGPSIICVGDPAVLEAEGEGSFLWSSGESTQSITVTEGGSYSVVVANQCGSSTATHAIQENNVLAAFDLDPYSGEAPLTVNFLNLSIPDDVPFLWDLGDGTFSTAISPQHTYLQPGEYLVTLTSTIGCSDTATFLLVVEGPEIVDPIASSIVVPNVFSPNGDGQNDMFEVMAEGIDAIELNIYSRWGHLVYQIDRPRQVWDGRGFSGETLVEGTYFYELKATGSDGRSHETRGTVTLVR